MTSNRHADLVIDVQTEHQQQGTRQLWFLVVAFVMSLLMPILLVAQVPDSGRSTAWVVTLAICVWSGLRLAWIIGQGKPFLFEFMFWLFVYIFFGLAASVQIRSGDLPSTTPGVDPGMDWPTVLFLLGCLLAFEVGRLFVRRSRSDYADAPARTRQINRRVAWLLLIIGSVMTAFYTSQTGIAALFQDRAARQTARASGFADTATASIVSSLAWIPLLIATGAFVYLRRQRRAQGTSGRYGLVIVAGAIGVLLLVNPISSARFTAGTVLFALVCYLGIFGTPTRVRLSLTGIIVAFLFLFPILDAFRTSSVSFARNGFFDEYAGNADYDAVWQVANTLSYIAVEGISWGGQALGVLFFWVPRSIWPDKPIDTGVLLANFRGYSVTNLSAPLWAEMAINVGVVCTVLLMVGLGAGVLKLDLRLPRAFSVGGTAAIIGAILPAYMIILLRGSLLQASGGLFVMIAGMVLLGTGSDRVTGAEPLGPFGRGRGSSGLRPLFAAAIRQHSWRN